MHSREVCASFVPPTSDGHNRQDGRMHPGSRHGVSRAPGQLNTAESGISQCHQDAREHDRVWIERPAYGAHEYADALFPGCPAHSGTVPRWVAGLGALPACCSATYSASRRHWARAAQGTQSGLTRTSRTQWRCRLRGRLDDRERRIGLGSGRHRHAVDARAARGVFPVDAWHGHAAPRRTSAAAVGSVWPVIEAGPRADSRSWALVFVVNAFRITAPCAFAVAIFAIFLFH